MKGRLLQQRQKHSKRQNDYYHYPTQVDTESTSNLDSLTMPTRTMTQTIEIKDFRKKNTTIHKQISRYRDVIDSSNGVTMLPFLGSLRTIKKRSNTLGSTESKPFSLSQKQPCLPKCRQSTCDFSAPNKSSMFYDYWHGKAGKQVKDTIDFEVSLRSYGKSQNLKRKQFNYLNTKVEYHEPQFMDDPQVYKCPKLMSLKNTINIK